MMILKNSSHIAAARPHGLRLAGSCHSAKHSYAEPAGRARGLKRAFAAISALAAISCAVNASAHAAPLSQDERGQTQGEHGIFLEGFPDVPYITGFTEDESARLIFDTPAGTIAQTDLWGPSAGGLSLFADTLQNMGWSCEQQASTGRAENGPENSAVNNGDSAPSDPKVAELMCILPDYRLEIDRITEKNDRTLYRLKSTPQPER